MRGVFVEMEIDTEIEMNIDIDMEMWINTEGDVFCIDQ